MMEDAIRFGPQHILVGLLSGVPGPMTETLILLNAGTFPRSGPFRLHVELARRLLPAGTPVLRFDMPGVGESPRLSDCSDVEAIRAAMDALESRFGCRRFVVGGVCSAADQAWRAADGDERVTGLLLLDGLSFDGPWYWVGRLRRLLRQSPRSWPASVRRFISGRRHATPAPAASDFRDWPTRGQARRQLQEFLQRDARLLFVYTGGTSERFIHRRQFRWSFGPASDSENVQLHFWPGCDHLFYQRGYRERLIGTIVGWLGGR